MLNPGDKLYKYVNGELVTYTFLEESVDENWAGVPSWLVEGSTGPFRCYSNELCTTIEAAQKWELETLGELLERAERQNTIAQRSLDILTTRMDTLKIEMRVSNETRR